MVRKQESQHENKPIANEKDLKQAYLWLKRETYYEHIDLFRRQGLAEFEDSEFASLKHILPGDLHELASKVSYRLLPKKVSTPEAQSKDDYGRHFISNLRSAEQYKIEDVHYFIDAPIGVHLLDVLWVWHVGTLLDKKLLKDCLGNRIELKQSVGPADKPWKLFRYYVPQYEKWRDSALECAEKLLENGKDVVIVGLDFKQAYYYLRIDWKHVVDVIEKEVKDETQRERCLALNSFLEKVHERFSEAIRAPIDGDTTGSVLGATHPELPGGNVLPIGLLSSGVLANWVMDEFDRSVLKRVRPNSYGRYVDDVIIVVGGDDTPKPGESAAIGQFFEELGLVARRPDTPPNEYEPGVLMWRDLPANKHEHGQQSSYDVARKADQGQNSSKPEWVWRSKLHRSTELRVGDDKTVVHYYDHDHSYGGLSEFRDELKRHASEFRFLPAEEENRNLVECAYDLQYEGSVNRLRSLVGVNENAHKLSVYLSRRLIENRLTSSELKKDIIDQLFRYYRGRNMFDFFRLWEKALTLLVVKGKLSECHRFYREIERTIEKARHTTRSAVADIFKEHAHEYLDIAMAQSLAFLESDEKSKQEQSSDEDDDSRENGDKPRDLEKLRSELSEPIRQLRSANLVRQQFVSWPLLSYVRNYGGSLVETDLAKLTNAIRVAGAEDGKALDEFKMKYAPRFIHLDEYLLFKYLEELSPFAPRSNECNGRTTANADAPVSPDRLFNIKKHVDDYKQNPNLPCPKDIKDIVSVVNGTISSKPNILQVKIRSTGKGSLAVGLANMRVNLQNDEASISCWKSPILSFARQSELFDLINQAEKTQCDMVVFPELSIPFSWLPFMVAQSRRKQIGFVFGLEHIVVGKHALNLVATVLPFETGSRYGNCLVSLRLKNHYAPKETRELARLDLEKPSVSDAYDLFRWRGVDFSVYNCFELSDIRHRALFRSKIDMLVAIEFNPDTDYYSNIVGATARDLHCYVVQVNTSQFGDSRITAPSSSRRMDLVKIKGGSNYVLLKGELQIDKLRDSQSRRYSSDDESFKPPPAGFDHGTARQRSQR